LLYNIEQALSVSDINATVNAEIHTVNQTDIDFAIFGIGDWLSGDYVQKGITINDIKSNVELNQDGINAAHFFMASGVSGHANPLPAGNWSDYANDSSFVGMPYGSAFITKLEAETDRDWDGTALVDTSFEKDGLIPLTATDKNESDHHTSGTLKNIGSSPGSALLQAVSHALFKKVGKNAAINNDTELMSDLQNKFYGAISGHMNEADTNYADSNMFKIYLDQGRYRSDLDDNADLAFDVSNANADAQNSTKVSYNLETTVVNMVVKLSGKVTDSDGSPTFDSTKIETIFGNHTALDTKVNHDDEGTYETKIFVCLKHDNRY